MIDQMTKQYKPQKNHIGDSDSTKKHMRSKRSSHEESFHSSRVSLPLNIHQPQPEPLALPIISPKLRIGEVNKSIIQSALNDTDDDEINSILKASEKTLLKAEKQLFIADTYRKQHITKSQRQTPTNGRVKKSDIHLFIHEFKEIERDKQNYRSKMSHLKEKDQR